jgi:hypothetical protein
MKRKPSLREAHAVRDGEADRRRELLDLVGHAILVAVGDRPHLALARADERHHALRPDRDVAGIRHDGIEPDLEPARQLDAGEILLDRLRLGAGLRTCGMSIGVPVVLKSDSFSRLPAVGACA